MKAVKNLFFLLIFLASLVALSSAKEKNKKNNDDLRKRRILSLIDYIRGDYQEAVHLGKIINQDEYKEMQTFAQDIERQLSQLFSGLSNKEETKLVMKQVKELTQAIEKKSAKEEILTITSHIKNRLVDFFSLQMSPSESLADPKLGQRLYLTYCSSCHGSEGRGDGPAAHGLKPAAKNFHEESVAQTSSPAKNFNTLITGIPETAMLSYSYLAEKDRWQLAFTVSSLPHKKNLSKVNAPEKRTYFQKLIPELIAKGLSLELLANSSDYELKEWLTKKIVLYSSLSSQEKDLVLSELRLNTSYQKDLPLKTQKIAAKLLQVNPLIKKLDFTKSLLAKAEKAFTNKLWTQSEDYLLDAYLDGFESLEKRLKLKSPPLVKSIESLFIQVRSYAKNGNPSFYPYLKQLKAQLARTEQIISPSQVLKKDQKANKAKDFLAGMTIILREGLEALLIVIALLAILKNIGAQAACLWVHAGWLSALLIGAISFFIFEKIIFLSGAQRELIEAVCTGTAAVLLFYTGFWLLSHNEKRSWDILLRSRTLRAIKKKKLWSLFFMSFIAVYREAAETILFYSALYSSSTNSWAITAGSFSGLAILSLLAFIMLWWQVKMPIKELFKLTSWLMVTLSIILLGKALFELIEAGYLNPTPLSGIPQIDFLGVYPILETLLAQGLALGLVFILISITQSMQKPLGKIYAE